MSDIVVKIARERSDIDKQSHGAADFDEVIDAREWAVYAVRAKAWRAVCEVGETRFGTTVGSAVAIASPDGRVAVWYGKQYLNRDKRGAKRQGRRDDTVNKYEAALIATNNACVAALWDGRRTRGGDRDVTPLANAACRVVHAHVFGDKPALRDVLLAPFACMTAGRPLTTHLLRASENELLAASALYEINNYEGGRALLARKGVAA